MSPRKVLRNQILKLREGLGTERIARELLADRKKKEVALVESSVMLDLDREKKARHESEATLMKLIDDKCFSMRLALAKEKKQREGAEEKHATEVSNAISKTNTDALDEMQRKTEDGNMLVQRLAETMHDLREQLKEEQRVREETERTMLRMLDDMVGNIQEELKAEMRDREATEEMLLRLLEETCSRVEHNAQQ